MASAIGGHNPPMQWTEPAGKLLVVQKAVQCRLGH
jgi:hypothetical protein